VTLILYADSLSDWVAWDDTGSKWERFYSSGSWFFTCPRCRTRHDNGWSNPRTGVEVCSCCVLLVWDVSNILVSAEAQGEIR
jgi:hypothetical protein